MNKITIIGNLTKDPTKREVNTANGTMTVCDFTVAVNKKKGGVSTATYFKCTAWRGLADVIAQYARKGSKVCVIGPVDASAYISQRDGKAVAQLEVTVEDFEFASSAKDAGNGSGAPAPVANYDAPAPAGFTPAGNDDLPF